MTLSFGDLDVLIVVSVIYRFFDIVGQGEWHLVCKTCFINAKYSFWPNVK